jgi:hypothetical protein
MADVTMQARAVRFAAGAGLLIRYGFYLAGLLVFGLLGLGLLAVMRAVPHVAHEAPSFSIADADFVRVRPTSEIVAGGRVGRSEAVQYGQLYEHDRDMTVIMVQPPQGRPLARGFAYELAAIPALRKAGARLHPVFYDLETRFGLLRAAEMHVDVDGRRKLCLAFLSRFDTPYLYLKGWICDANGARPSPGHLACLIGRIVLDRPLESADADAFMRAGLARSPSCSASPVSQTTDTRPPRRSPRR